MKLVKLSVLKGRTSGFARENLVFLKRGFNFFYKQQTDICGISQKLSKVMIFFKEIYMLAY